MAGTVVVEVVVDSVVVVVAVVVVEGYAAVEDVGVLEGGVVPTGWDRLVAGSGKMMTCWFLVIVRGVPEQFGSNG